jgi:diguanylate cyclase (GGDEF)-like protein
VVAPTIQRLVGSGLAFAALALTVLAVLVVVELSREADLHRAALDAQDVKDRLETLRLSINEVRNGARVSALAATDDAKGTLERHVRDIESDLAFLRERAAHDAALPTLDALEQASRLLAIHAQSVDRIRRQRGGEAAAAAALETERVAGEAQSALAVSLDTQTNRINERMSARVHSGETLRRYVEWFVGAAIAALGALFVAFRRLQRREREALRRAEWLAHYDVVTGLPNRALLNDRLGQECARARRAGESFALLALDLDGFKPVNDTWGHPAGDRVLAMVAERARGCMRASDTIGRLGGDEFLALLPATNEAGALEAAEKVKAAISAPYAFDGIEPHLGVSIVVAIFPAHGGDAERLWHAADDALYEAKRAGRDRVRLAHTGDAAQAAPMPEAD